MNLDLAAAALSVGAVPVSAELLYRRFDLSPETGRKLVHVGAALLVLPLPLLVTYHQIAALGVLFAGGLVISRRRRLLTALLGVERRTYGELLYPLGIAVLAIAFPQPVPFVFGVAVVGLADGLAAPVGLRLGGRRLPGGKSVAGCATFFAVALTAGVLVLVAGGAPAPVVLAVAVPVAALLTAVEASLSGGLDNLVLPVLAGLLIGIA